MPSQIIIKRAAKNIFQTYGVNIYVWKLITFLINVSRLLFRVLRLVLEV